jgi:hypothetical protein
MGKHQARRIDPFEPVRVTPNSQVSVPKGQTDSSQAVYCLEHAKNGPSRRDGMIWFAATFGHPPVANKTLDRLNRPYPKGRQLFS